MSAANLKVTELYQRVRQSRKDQQYVDRPSNVSDVAGLVASAMSVLETTKQANGSAG